MPHQLSDTQVKTSSTNHHILGNKRRQKRLYDKHRYRTNPPRKWNGVTTSALTFGLLGLAVLIGFMYVLSQNYSMTLGQNLDLDKTSKVGDFIGGLIGALWSFAGFLLLYQALRVQTEAFNAQRDALETQQKELGLQRAESQNHRTEFIINRITSIVFQQLEITEKAMDRVVYQSFDGGQKPSKGLIAIRNIPRLSLTQLYFSEKQSSKSYKDQLEHLFLFTVHDPEVNIYINKLKGSLKICYEQIQSKRFSEDKGIITSSFLLNERDRLSLLNLLSHNFVLDDSFSFLVALHKICTLKKQHVIDAGNAHSPFIGFIESKIEELQEIMQLIRKISPALSKLD